MLIEYYECDCHYRVTRDDVDTEKVKLSDHMVNELHETFCDVCNESCACTKKVQIKRYVCPNCKKDLMLKTGSDGNDDETCESISGKTLQIMGSPYKKPIHSDALGMQPDQVAEHREKFPNIEIDNQNRPVFTNRADHDKYMEKCGIVKHASSNKKRGTIYSIPGTSCHRERNLKN